MWTGLEFLRLLSALSKIHHASLASNYRPTRSTAAGVAWRSNSSIRNFSGNWAREGWLAWPRLGLGSPLRRSGIGKSRSQWFSRLIHMNTCRGLDRWLEFWIGHFPLGQIWGIVLRTLWYWGKKLVLSRCPKTQDSSQSFWSSLSDFWGTLGSRSNFFGRTSGLYSWSDFFSQSSKNYI